MKLIFKTGSILEKIDKCRILDNMRTEITKKIFAGVEFSNETTLALYAFPESQIETFFAIVNDKIVKGVDPNRAATLNYSVAGYSIAEFDKSRYYDLSQYQGQELIEKTAEQNEKKDFVCYHISELELEKIGWTDAAVVPSFVTEVFTKLNCMPQEIIN